MTHTLTAPHDIVSSAPAPRPVARWTVSGGLVAGPLFLVTGCAQGFAREGFDFTRNAISQLALGESGWIQTVNFLLAGALLLAGAAGLRQVLRGTPGGTGARSWSACSLSPSGPLRSSRPTWGGLPAGAPEATVMSGHGAVHMFGGMVGYLALCAAFFVLARPLAARGLRVWTVATRLVPVVVLAGFMASAVSVLAFTAGAGLGLLWLTAVTARLAGTPANR